MVVLHGFVSPDRHGFGGEGFHFDPLLPFSSRIVHKIIRFLDLDKIRATLHLPNEDIEKAAPPLFPHI